MNLETYKKAYKIRTSVNQLLRLKQELSGYRFELVADAFIELINQKLKELEKEFDEL